MWRAVIRWLSCIAVLCVLAHGAFAGPTGASMGGGSWGAKSSSGTSTSSSSSYTPSSSSSDSTVTYGSSFRAGNGDLGGLGMVVAIAIGVVVVIALAIAHFFRDFVSSIRDNHSNLGPSYDPGPYTPPTSYTDVTVLRIALDGHVRAFVKSELARVATAADPATPEGRATQLREVALLLRRLKDAWVMGGVVNEDMRDRADQQVVFDRHVARAHTGDRAPHAAPGDDAILVTVVVHTHTELFDVAVIGDGADLRHALESASHRTAEDLIDIAIIWTPADDAVRLTTRDLGALYPVPELLPISDALVGKVFCAACSGPFPAELVSCPHCGAPATGAIAAT